MTVEEAIKSIDDVLNSDYHYDESIGYQMTSDDFEWLEKSKEALEKQIPKKPIIQKMKILDCIDQIQIFNKKICPSCGTVLCADWNFCFECGQKLDWE